MATSLRAPLKNLLSDDSFKRSEVYRDLQGRPSIWKDFIPKALSDPDPVVRRGAIIAAGTVAGSDIPWVTSLVLSALSDEDQWVRFEACVVVSSSELTSRKIMKKVLEMVSDSSPAHRAAAIDALAYAGTSTATEHVREALTDPHPNIRIAAIESLLKIFRGQLRILDEVGERLLDEDLLLRDIAIFDLSEAVFDCISRFKGIIEKMCPQAPEIRENALHGLGKMSKEIKKAVSTINRIPRPSA